MMRSVLTAAVVLAAFGGTFVAGHARAEEAGEACNVPMAQWQPKQALKKKLVDAGYKVRSITTEAGCYEAYAIDKNGRRVKASFNPKTLQVVNRRDNDAE